MPLKKKRKVITQNYSRNKYQRRVKGGKEVEYREDIKEINMDNCTFYKRFEGERMNAQFTHLFWLRTTTKVSMWLRDRKEYILALIDNESKINII